MILFQRQKSLIFHLEIEFILDVLLRKLYCHF